MSMASTLQNPDVTFLSFDEPMARPQGTPKNWVIRDEKFNPKVFAKADANDIFVIRVENAQGFLKHSKELSQLFAHKNSSRNGRFVVGVDKPKKNDFLAMSEIMSVFPHWLRPKVELSMGERSLMTEIYKAFLKTPGAQVATSHRKLADFPAISEAVSILRTDEGKLSANLVTDCFGLTLTQLAAQLGMKKQAVSKGPTSKTMQKLLLPYERIAQLLASMELKKFHTWLNRPMSRLDGLSPLAVLDSDDLEIDKFEVIANLAESQLTGAPA